MYLYDIHTHQASAAQATGHTVKTVMNTYPTDYYKQKALYPDTFFSCGIHPWYSQDYNEQIGLLKNIAKENSVVAIGEAGLDKLRGLDIEIQKEIFHQHILLAEEHNKPLIIHCVKAWDVLVAMHKESKQSVPWIIHGYRGNMQQAKQLIDQGFMFSIGEKYNQEALRTIPLTALFCETDMSAMSIYDIYMNISAVLDINIEELCTIIDSNIKRVFYIR